MAESIRLFGAGIVLSSALTLACNITLFKSPTTFNLVCSTSIAAGTYDLFSFAAKVNSQLRADISAKAIAAGVDTVPAIASILFRFDFPSTWSATPGANVINCTFNCTGFLEGGVQVSLTAFSLDNSSGWATKLGLGREITTSLVGVLTSPSATVTGTHQPRSIFCFDNSCRDTWDNEVRPFESTLHLANGKKRGWSRGVAEAYRMIELVDLASDITGPPLDVKTFGAFGANRSILNFVDSDESGLTNVPDINTNLAPLVGDLLRVGNDDFWSRITSTTGTTSSTGELWPSTIVPTVGDSVWQISEAHALWIEAYATEWLFVFEPNDSTGQSFFKALAYRLDLNGKVVLPFDRRDPFLSLYTMKFELTRRDTPETVVV